MTQELGWSSFTLGLLVFTEQVVSNCPTNPLSCTGEEL